MEWYLIIALAFGGLIALMATGMPVAFAFFAVNVIGAAIVWGGEPGLFQLVRATGSSITNISLLPLPLFILMGQVMFQSGIAPRMIEALDKWLGRIPGRLGILAIAGGTVFATLSGSSASSCATLGSVLAPEMKKRKYKESIAFGSIMGSGGLAILIPPSGLAVLIAAVGGWPVGKTLIAIIVPGIIMAILYASYIVGRCWLQPDIAPPYDAEQVPLHEKVVDFLKYVLPLSLVVLMVTGLIFFGIATPTESGATGALSCFILTAIYGKLNWPVLKGTFIGAAKLMIMLFIIIASSACFSQILAFTGASAGLANFMVSLPFADTWIVLCMLAVGTFLGLFMDVNPIVMICIPLFAPVVKNLGIDPVWFAAMFLLTVEMGVISPPFGINLFIMRGVASDTTMGVIYKAAIPFFLMDFVVLAIMLLFPITTLWLPSLMK